MSCSMTMPSEIMTFWRSSKEKSLKRTSLHYFPLHSLTQLSFEVSNDLPLSGNARNELFRVSMERFGQLIVRGRTQFSVNVV